MDRVGVSKKKYCENHFNHFRTNQYINIHHNFLKLNLNNSLHQVPFI